MRNELFIFSAPPRRPKFGRAWKQCSWTFIVSSPLSMLTGMTLHMPGPWSALSPPRSPRTGPGKGLASAQRPMSCFDVRGRVWRLAAMTLPPWSSARQRASCWMICSSVLLPWCPGFGMKGASRNGVKKRPSCGTCWVGGLTPSVCMLSGWPLQPRRCQYTAGGRAGRALCACSRRPSPSAMPRLMRSSGSAPLAQKSLAGAALCWRAGAMTRAPPSLAFAWRLPLRFVLRGASGITLSRWGVGGHGSFRHGPGTATSGEARNACSRRRLRPARCKKRKWHRDPMLYASWPPRWGARRSRRRASGHAPWQPCRAPSGSLTASPSPCRARGRPARQGRGMVSDTLPSAWCRQWCMQFGCEAPSDCRRPYSLQ